MRMNDRREERKKKRERRCKCFVDKSLCGVHRIRDQQMASIEYFNDHFTLHKNQLNFKLIFCSTTQCKWCNFKFIHFSSATFVPFYPHTQSFVFFFFCSHSLHTELFLQQHFGHDFCVIFINTSTKWSSITISSCVVWIQLDETIWADEVTYLNRFEILSLGKEQLSNIYNQH